MSVGGDARAPRFPLVDGLRAVAALCVLGTHAAFFAGAYSSGGLVGRVAARLDVGVAIFFVISGFVLYRQFAARHLLDRPAPPLGRYALRRAARILLAYWLALTVIAWVRHLSGVHGTGALRYYLLGQIYRTDTIGQGLVQAWTLCVEVTFYAFLPLWAALVRRLARRSADRVRVELLALAILAAASLAWKVVVLLSQADPGQIVVTPWLISLPGYLDQFALGMALAVLSVRTHELGRPPTRVLGAIGRRPGGAVAVAVAAFLVVALGLGIGSAFLSPMSRAQYLGRHLLFALVGTMLVAVAVTGDRRRGWSRWLLGSPPVLWLGTLSYGIYLWHDAALSQLAAWGVTPRAHVPAILWWPAAGLLLGGACAAASWYLLESPVLRRVHHVGARQRTPEGAAGDDLARAQGALEAAPTLRPS